jgi:hypothetical protein
MISSPRIAPQPNHEKAPEANAQSSLVGHRPSVSQPSRRLKPSISEGGDAAQLEDKMLGEKIGEEIGKVNVQRVLPGPVPRLETSFSSAGTLLGIPARTFVTYESVMRADGSLAGEGQGMVMGEGGLMATFRGQGVGIPKPDGSVSFRGSLIYSTASSKWARLNGIAVVFEHDVDPTGKTIDRAFEWK